MRLRLLVATAALAATSMSLLSAHAGEYTTNLEMLQGASGEGVLSNGGKAKFALVKLTGIEWEGPQAVVPVDSGNVDLPIAYGLPVPGITGQGQPARYLGCIQITVGKSTDGSCAVVRPATTPSSATFDPLLDTGSMSFSVPSKLTGYSITATALFTATGQPAPTHSAKPEVISVAGTPRRAELVAGVSFTRTASLIGQVRSPIVGGGVFKTVTKSGLFGGLGNVAVADRTLPFCMSPTGSQSKPGDMPWNEFPPKPWVPGPPTINNFDPNNPRYDAQNPPSVTMPSMPYSPTRICPADV